MLISAQEIPSLAAFAVFGELGACHGEQNSPGSKCGLTAASRSAMISCIHTYKYPLPQMKSEQWLWCPHIHWCGNWAHGVLQLLLKSPHFFIVIPNNVNILWGQMIKKWLIFAFLATSVGANKILACRPDFDKLSLIFLGKERMLSLKSPKWASFWWCCTWFWYLGKGYKRKQGGVRSIRTMNQYSSNKEEWYGRKNIFDF